jgi:hypothetical protein
LQQTIDIRHAPLLHDLPIRQSENCDFLNSYLSPGGHDSLELALMCARVTWPGMLSLWRRYLRSCPFKAEGCKYTKCSCPIWCDGEINGVRVWQSLDTRNWGRAGRKLATLEEDVEHGRESKTVRDATAAFLLHCEIEPATRKKYTRWSDRLSEFAESREIDVVSRFSLSLLDQYKATREVAPLTWSKELQFLRSFFAFCQARRWTSENPAKAMKMPPDPKPGERPPYTRDEAAKILAACDRFGPPTSGCSHGPSCCCCVSMGCASPRRPRWSERG